VLHSIPITAPHRGTGAHPLPVLRCDAHPRGPQECSAGDSGAAIHVCPLQ